MTEAGNRDERVRAYRAAGRIAKERMAREAPLDGRALEAVEASDIVVVRGRYDHVEMVLDALEMPFTAVDPAALGRVRLRPEQLLVIDCPGVGIDPDRVRAFVDAGGSLFSTDWALKHVLEPAFPGTVEHNGGTTADEVVRVTVRSAENPFLRGVMDGTDDPQWWLEGSSYPIRVLDPARVEVLMESAELGARYGESPVAVLFGFGEGEVFHMISHYYLQRTELREARHRAAAPAYLAEKGLAVDAEMASALDGLAVGDVESAAASARLFANVVAAKKRRAMAPEPRDRRPAEGGAR